MLFLKRLGLLAGFVVLAASFVVLLGKQRWKSATSELLARLKAVQKAARSLPLNHDQLAGLPTPVQRYLRSVLPEGGRPLASVFITHTGWFNMSAIAENWKRFVSEQTVSMDPPDFVWNADIAFAPMVSVRVHDAYIEQSGYLQASVLGLLPVASLKGGGDIAAGELLRFLAESVWYPSILLPGGPVEWHAIDDYSARAVLKDGPQTAELLFAFGEDGLVETVFSSGRGQVIGQETKMVPWGGRFARYEMFDGILIPMEGEVLWYPEDGPHSYYRATMTSVRFEFAEPALAII